MKTGLFAILLFGLTGCYTQFGSVSSSGERQPDFRKIEQQVNDSTRITDYYDNRMYSWYLRNFNYGFGYRYDDYYYNRRWFDDTFYPHGWGSYVQLGWGWYYPSYDYIDWRIARWHDWHYGYYNRWYDPYWGYGAPYYGGYSGGVADRDDYYKGVRRPGGRNQGSSGTSTTLPGASYVPINLGSGTTATYRGGGGSTASGTNSASSTERRRESASQGYEQVVLPPTPPVTGGSGKPKSTTATESADRQPDQAKPANQSQSQPASQPSASPAPRKQDSGSSRRSGRNR